MHIFTCTLAASAWTTRDASEYLHEALLWRKILCCTAVLVRPHNPYLLLLSWQVHTFIDAGRYCIICFHLGVFSWCRPPAIIYRAAAYTVGKPTRYEMNQRMYNDFVTLHKNNIMQTHNIQNNVGTTHTSEPVPVRQLIISRVLMDYFYK